MASSNRKNWIALCTIMIVLSACCMSFAETLTLDDCIEIALKKNQDAIRARNQVKTADGSVWNAFGAFLPSISASGSRSETHTDERTMVYDVLGIISEDDSYSVPPDTLLYLQDTSIIGGTSKNYSLGASANWTIFNGGQNIFNYSAARANKKYYSHLAESSEQAVILNVKTYYFNYLKALDQRDVSEEAVKRGEEQYKLAKSRYEVGSASKSDVLKAQVQFGNDKLTLLAAQNNVKIAKAELTYYIGLDVNSDVEYSDQFEPKKYDGSEMEALTLGLTNHPGLLASEQLLNSAKYGVRSAYGNYLPSLSLGLSKNWSADTWNRVKEFNSEDGQWTFSATLSIPIFQGFSRKSNVTSAKVSLNNARTSYYYAKNNVALGIKEAYLEIQRADQALQVAGENVEAAKEDMSLVQEKYNLGAATILELLDAQVSLLTAQISKIKADFDYNLAVARLENAMGVR